jgi:pyruvate/2-oxoglutarate dehydrogenase complex dihydrolipoamide dehydrogenase (E3) component
MSQPEQYEVLVLGGGERGKYLAWHLAKSGRRTAVVERKWIGGSCPNVDCMPSAVRVARLPMSAVLRARTTGETAGFMKVLIESAGDRLLGFAMLGPESGEVLAVVQTAMLGGLSYTVLRDAILAHPTMAEGLGGLFAAVPAAPR